MATTIALVAQKGGTGKTNTALGMASALHGAGYNVLTICADDQNRGATSWQLLREQQQEGKEGPHVQTVTLDEMAGAIRAAKRERDVVLVDTPPAIGKETRTAMAMADVVVILCQPSPADVVAVPPTVEALQKAAKAKKAPIPACIVINKADRDFIATESTVEAVGAHGLPVFEIPLYQDFAWAYGYGLGVSEYRPNGRAAEVMHLTTQNILNLEK